MRPAKKSKIDWRAVHGALAARAAAPIAVALGGVAAERLLSERTMALAARGAQPSEATTRVIRLRTGAERYALPLSATREVVEVQHLAPLPGIRGGAILGILNWRGTFVAVFDLAALVGSARSTEPRRAVVLAGDAGPCALAVDAAEEVITLDFSALQPAAQLARKAPSLFLGATAEGLIVLDVAPLWERLKREFETA